MVLESSVAASKWSVKRKKMCVGPLPGWCRRQRPSHIVREEVIVFANVKPSGLRRDKGQHAARQDLDRKAGALKEELPDSRSSIEQQARNQHARAVPRHPDSIVSPWHRAAHRFGHPR